MAYLNEISVDTVQEWLSNFENLSQNIYSIFQENEIVLSKDIYNAITKDGMYRVRFYFGLGNENNPKVIAVGTYELLDVDHSLTGFCDILTPGKIYELYSGETITLEMAQGYISNWKENIDDSNFLYGFLVPKPNLMLLFEELEHDEIKLFFGYDNEIKCMLQKVEPQQGDVVIDNVSPCPTCCPKNTTLIE